MRTRFGVTTEPRQQSGFSLLELLIVLAITLVVGAMATPRITNALAQYEVRQSALQLSGLFQRARIAAVQANQPVRVRTVMDASGRQRAYVDMPGGTVGSFDRGEPTVLLPNKVTVLTAGPGDPTASLTVSGNTTWNTTDAQFNGRGLPCVTSGGVCVNLLPGGGNQQGFEYFIRGNGIFGQNHWAAVVISPGGRIKSLMYNGSSYK